MPDPALQTSSESFETEHPFGEFLKREQIREPMGRTTVVKYDLKIARWRENVLELEDALSEAVRPKTSENSGDKLEFRQEDRVRYCLALAVLIFAVSHPEQRQFVCEFIFLLTTVDCLYRRVREGR